MHKVASRISSAVAVGVVVVGNPASSATVGPLSVDEERDCAADEEGVETPLA